jgi:cysteine-rich repeat protein
MCQEICGDGLMLGIEKCDDGTQNGLGCNEDCSGPATGFTCQCSIAPCSCLHVCGDGIRVEGEQCDDGNTKSNDGCSNDCLVVENGFTCESKFDFLKEKKPFTPELTLSKVDSFCKSAGSRIAIGQVS